MKCQQLRYTLPPTYLLQLQALLLKISIQFSHRQYAHHLLDQIPQSNLPLFNSLFKHLSQLSLFPQTLQLYSHMRKLNLGPDQFTLPPILKACAGLSAFCFCQSLHTHILKLGFTSDTFVQNGLIAVYLKSSQLSLAERVFAELTRPNVVSWTLLISGLSQNGSPVEALRFFRTMMASSNVKPDFITLVSVLKSYTDVEDLVQGRCVHGLVVKSGFYEEPDLVITLTSMYAKCGEVGIARALFDGVPNPGLILWNVIISGYAKNGLAEDSVELFREMVVREVRPDSITIRLAVMSCAQLGSLEIGRWMEDYACRGKYRNDVFVNTALIDMYAKCGSLIDAHRVFRAISDKDVVVWSAMVVGYGLHGRAREAMSVFHEMIGDGVNPNDVTFIGILSACNHAGLVEEGWNYFHSMKDYAIEPRHQHYACVVDLLARAGHLLEAYRFIKSMPLEPEVSVWGALLNACRTYNHVGLGEIAAEHIFNIEPWNAGHYVQLSNIYASAAMWSDVARVRVLMKERGVAKEIGSSLIEMDGKLHSFRAGDKSHPRSKEIFAMVDELERRLNDFDFVPYIDRFLYGFSEEEGAVCVN